ncbi:MAG: DUF4919 domain-containing protein [Anaerolineae bacterium]
MRTYEALLPAARRDPHGTDFTELRLAYARSSGYDPYLFAKDAAEAFAKVTLARQVGDVAGLIRALNALLDVRFLEVEAHGLAMSAYKRVGDNLTSAYHPSVVDGCMSSIFQSGDGQSFDSAFQVITASEEWAVLRALGLDPSERRLIKYRDRCYDLFLCPKGETGEIWFDIDAICRHLSMDEVFKIVSGRQALPGEQPVTGDEQRAEPARRTKSIADKVCIVSFSCLVLGVLLMGYAHTTDIRALGIAGAVVSLLSTLGAMAGAVLLVSAASEWGTRWRPLWVGEIGFGWEVQPTLIVAG